MKAAHFRLWGGLLVAALSLVPGMALSQQQALAAGGNGIKIGEGRVHPYLDLELRFDSAAGFFVQGTTLSNNLQPELIAHFRPGLRLDLPSDFVALDAAGDVDYLYYTGLLTPSSTAASRLEGAADINADFNRKGTVGFFIGDQLLRSDRTHNVALGVGVLSFFNEVRAGVPIRPGGGALEVTPKAAFTLEFFDPISNVPIPGCTATDVTCTPSAVRAMNYLNLRPALEARWKFLPKTAIVFESSFDARSYPNPAGNPPADLLKATLGISGLLTPRISVVAKVGWGYDFAGTGANTFLAHLEGTYILNEASSFKAGYLRNLEPVPSYGTYGDDRGYIEGRMLINGRLNLRGTAAFDYISFYGNSNRNDTVFGLELAPEYQIFPWLLASGGYLLTTHYSNLSAAASNNYTRNEAFVRVTFAY